MASDEMFLSAVRPSADLAGVFEYDGDTGYFYLYRTAGIDGNKVLAAIHVLSDSPDFTEDDIAIRWDTSATIVGLTIRGAVWAAFDSQTGMQYGGNYVSLGGATIPDMIRTALES